MTLGWIIFWLIIVAWLAVGFSRQHIYYKRHFNNQVESWGTLGGDKRKEMHHKEAAWVSLGLAIVWGWYELGLLYRNKMILRMTKEERQLAELEKARKIIADWEAKEKSDFDKALGRAGEEGEAPKNYEYL
jgi:hypothetical protein